MSLEETYEALQFFARELESFDERLKVGHAEIHARQDAIDALWRDSLRGKYDALIGDLDHRVSIYANSRSEQFEQFMAMKIDQLRHYLHGD